MMEWQDISTAPKDGTLIAVWYNIMPCFSHGTELKSVVMRPGIGMWSTWDACFRILNSPSLLNNLEGHAPTHWLSLPETPK